MKATGTWVVLKDPREKKEESVIQLLDETKDRIAKDTDNIQTNILEVLSAGEHCKDSKLFVEGVKVIIDPRMPVAVINIEQDESKEEKFVLVVQENQIMIVL